MNKTLSWIVAILVVGVLGTGCYLALHKVGGKGGTSNADDVALNGSLTLGMANYGSGTASYSGGVVESANYGNCADQSTTLFAVQNPNSSTSTARVVRLNGQQGTTSTDFLVGTSTTATAPVNANLSSPSGLAARIVATSTQFFLASGVTGNDTNAATGATFAVGPGQYVLGQATSSYSGSSATGNGGITNPTNTLSCSYEIIWLK